MVFVNVIEFRMELFSDSVVVSLGPFPSLSLALGSNQIKFTQHKMHFGLCSIPLHSSHLIAGTAPTFFSILYFHFIFISKNLSHHLKKATVSFLHLLL